jgi:hypothetical protein
MTQAVRSLGSRYQLEAVLGSGAMGQVWRARDLRTQEAVAAKLLREELASDPQLVGRFVQERSILVELVHPHIVAVRDLVVDGGDLGIVMDLIDGEDLRAHLTSRGTLRPAEAVRMTVDVLAALAAAHARSVLHRDVKPDNVLLDRADPPYVRLTDFGIARIAQETTVRMTGVLGTAEYIAPEVFTAERVSAAADVYGAGVLLYELLAGRTPFAGGGTSYAIAYRHVTTPPPDIPGLPPALAAVLGTMLAKTPADRPTATVAAAELRALAGRLAGSAAIPPMAEPQWHDATTAPLSVDVRSDTGGGRRDAQATSIQGELAGGVAPPKPLSAPQPGAALAPSATPEALASQTQLHGPRVPRPVVDLPDAPALSDKSKRWRRTALLVVIVVVLVGGLGTAGFLLFGGHHGTKTPGPVAAPALTAPQADQPTGSGLIITRTASYTLKGGQFTTTITYSTAQTGTLSGPFFESIPPVLQNGSCPTPTFAQVAATQDVGLDAQDCGWDIGTTATTVTKDRPLTVQYTEQFPASAANQTAVQTYIDSEGTDTAAALAQIQTGTSFAAQRLLGVDVEVTNSVVGRNVPIQVYPVWTAASQTETSDKTSPLYTTTAPLQNALDATLGGLGPPFTQECGSNVVVKSRIMRAVTPTQSATCTVEFTLGGQQVQSQDSFEITPPGG